MLQVSYYLGEGASAKLEEVAPVDEDDPIASGAKPVPSWVEV